MSDTFLENPAHEAIRSIESQYKAWNAQASEKERAAILVIIPGSSPIETCALQAKASDRVVVIGFSEKQTVLANVHHSNLTIVMKMTPTSPEDNRPKPQFVYQG
jgi:hypothetical protein